MNKNVKVTTIALALVALTIGGCKKEDEENELKLSFKTGAGYTASDVILAKATAFKVGVEGETEKKKDPIVKFNISESVNSGATTSIFNEDIEKQDYEHDHDFTVNDTVHGNKHRYTFTITNKDGLTKQQALTVTVQ